MRVLPPAIARLLNVLRPQRSWMWGGVALAAMAGLAAVGLIAVSGWFIAAMALAGVSGAAINYFSPAAAIRALAITRSGGRYGERLVTHEATLRGLAGLRAWLFLRLIPLAPARLAALKSAELFSRLRADVDALEQFYLAVLVPVAVAAVVLLVVLSFTLAVLPAAFIVLLIGVLLGVLLLPQWVRRRAAGDAAAAVGESAELRALLLDALRGHAELLAFGGVAAHAARIGALDALLAERRRRLERWQSFGGGGTLLLAHWTVLGVLVAGLAAVGAGAMAPPLLTMITLLTLSSFEVIGPVSEALAQWQAIVVAAERVFELADLRPAVSEPKISAPISRPPGIQFLSVGLRYEADAPWALDELSLEVAPGARLAIVGASGAGKSSLLAVLQKFHAPDAGVITFGGQSLTALDGDELRRHIAVISQQTTLFNRSLRDNLLLAAPEAGRAQIERAVHLAQLDGFVARLPQGYDTVLGEAGAQVSGGEARRIAIARALLLNAPVLVLDEPTEGLDARTARDLYGALDAAASGRTLLLITHRLGGLADLVDEVAVMQAGRIRERVPALEYIRRAAASKGPRS